MSVHSPLPGMHLMRTRTTSAYVPPLSPPLLVDRPLSPQQPQIIDNNFFYNYSVIYTSKHSLNLLLCLKIIFSVEAFTIGGQDESEKDKLREGKKS